MGWLSAMGKPWNNQLAQWDGKTGYFSWFTWPIYSQAFLIYQWAIFHSHILGFPHVGNELYIWKYHTFEMIDAFEIIYIYMYNMCKYMYIYNIQYIIIIYIYTILYIYIYTYIFVPLYIDTWNTSHISYLEWNMAGTSLSLYIYI